MELAGAGTQAFVLLDDSGYSFQLDGSMIDPSSTIRSQKITRAHGKGGLKVIAKQFSVEINHANATLHSAFENADHNVVKWQVQVLGFAYAALCNEKSTFSFESQLLADPTSEDFPFKIAFEVTGKRIGSGMNLLYAYWQAESIDIPANGSTNLTIDIPFGFEGIEVTLSNGATDIELQARDASNSTLQTSSTTVGSGRVYADMVTPVGTRSLRVILADVQKPSLRIDGKSTFPN